MEPELPRWRLAVLVQRRKLGGEFMGIRHFIHHISILTQEGLGVWYALVGSPCNQCGCKIRQQFVDGFHGLEFAVQHILAELLGEDFNKE